MGQADFFVKLDPTELNETLTSEPLIEMTLASVVIEELN